MFGVKTTLAIHRSPSPACLLRIVFMLQGRTNPGLIRHQGTANDVQILRLTSGKDTLMDGAAKTAAAGRRDRSTRCAIKVKLHSMMRLRCDRFAAKPAVATALWSPSSSLRL